MAKIASVRLVVGLEVHVELATRTKMFSRAPSPAFRGHENAGPNTCLDPVVLGLPGALPTINREAVEMSIRVGLALNCSIATQTRWDRKGYFYPDMPKGYQISQYDLPLCFDGSFDLPGDDGAGGPRAPGGPGGQGGQGGAGGAGGARGVGTLAEASDGAVRIGIIRAHLEEDAGKLLHEAPSGGSGTLDGSIVDLNRAGTPLLEIVTAPDFSTADQVVRFCRELRRLCRCLGVTQGVLQRGHMRFEPNVNCVLTLEDGRTVRTPIVEVKNLNSFKAVGQAIEYEFAEQPRRWLADGKEMGPGSKSTRGFDLDTGVTTLQREKEDAQDYRYFPDPDLLPLVVDRALVERLRGELPEAPLARRARYVDRYALGVKEAAALIEDREDCEFFERATAHAAKLGVDERRAGRLAANILLQSGLRRAKEHAAAIAEATGSAETPASDGHGGDGAGGSSGTGAVAEAPLFSALGISTTAVGELVQLRDEGAVNNAGLDELFGLLCDAEQAATSARELAAARGLLVVRDDAAMEAWCDGAIAQQAQAAADVRAGKDAAIGRLVGAAMKLAAGKGDASQIRARLLEKLRG